MNVESPFTGDKPEWWKDIKCTSAEADNTLNSQIKYETVGGSDYWNPQTKTWENVLGTSSNSKNNSNSQVELWNSATYPPNCQTPSFTTETVVTDGIHNFYNLKETK